MRDLARGAAAEGGALSPAHHRLFRAWLLGGHGFSVGMASRWAWLLGGIPAFAAVLAIIWPMPARPALHLR
ncbi:MAG: hypothetical protein K2X49_23745 [Acetobacteraceae bacterium]|nr:hypothetical protein [Acetobacteraceae bacterium]